MKAPASRSSIFQLLKQHFTGPKRVELPVSAYGKLPIYKDFLRHGLAGQEAQAFKRWLDRGVSRLWAVHESYRDEEIPSLALLLSFPATGKSVLGYLWGSHDHGGLRRFPFALFVSLPAPTSSNLPLLFALDQVVEQASALRRKLERVSSLDAYYPLIRTSRFHLEIHGEKVLKERLLERREPTVGDLADVFYGEDDEADRWPALLRHLRRSGESSGKPFSGRLPSTGALPAAELVSLWSLLLGDSRRQARRPLQLIYSPGASYAGITLLYRDLQPEDIYAFHPEMPGYEAIDDFRHDVPGARRRAPEPAPPEEPEDSGAATEDPEEPAAPDEAEEPELEAGSESTEEDPAAGTDGEEQTGREKAEERDDSEEEDEGEEKDGGASPSERGSDGAAERDDGSPEDASGSEDPVETVSEDEEETQEEDEASAEPPPPTDSGSAEQDETAEATRARDDSADEESAAEPRRPSLSGELTREQRAAPFHAVLDEDFLRP